MPFPSCSFASQYNAPAPYLQKLTSFPSQELIIKKKYNFLEPDSLDETAVRETFMSTYRNKKISAHLMLGKTFTRGFQVNKDEFDLPAG